MGTLGWELFLEKISVFGYLSQSSSPTASKKGVYIL